MLSLNDPIGKGKYPGLSVKASINLNKKEVHILIECNGIELNEEALQYMEDGKGLGVIDYGTRTIDFFPDNNYLLDGRN